MNGNDIRTVNVVQYLKPLREGGSLPAIVKADDGFLYVLKFRGAGQGKKALIAELIGGELARAMGLHVPELVFMELDDSFSKTEPDEEIQDLLKFSVGLNLGLHFLSGAITYDPLVSKIDGLEASKVLLLDCIISNIDRTAKNTNLLMWNQQLWLIDHGAALYFHHNWDNWKTHQKASFAGIKNHVLLSKSTELKTAEIAIKEAITPMVIETILNLIPEEWLIEPGNSFSPAEIKKAYSEVINFKISNLDQLVQEALDAQ